MFCTKCGKQLDRSAKFCTACGKPVPAEIDPLAPSLMAGCEPPRSPESPVIAEPEEPRSPESPVIAMPAPAEQTPAEPPAPTFDEFARENPAPTKRKKKKIVPWIAGGTAVVLIGTAAVGYFGFYNRFMRLVLGDAGFALHVEKKTGEFLSPDGRASAKLNETLAARIDEIFLRNREQDADRFDVDDDEQAQLSAMIAALLPVAERFGGRELTCGLSIESDELLGALLTLSDSGLGSLSLLGNFQNTLCVSHTETADQFELTTRYDGTNILNGALTIDPQKFAVAFPALSSYTFFSEYAPTEDEPALACSAEEVERLCGAVMELYYEAYAEAEITYEDGRFSVAGQSVEGTRIRATLSAEQTNALYQKINDLLKNDEYLRDYYRRAAGEASGYDALFEDPDAFSAPLISESYIGKNAKLLAKTYTVGKSEEEDPFTLAYAATEETDHLRIGTPDGERIGIDAAKDPKTEADDGTVEFSYVKTAEEDAPVLVLALDYVNRGTVESFGETVTLGTYTLRVSDKDTMIRSFFREGLGGTFDGDPMTNPSSIFGAMLEKFALTVSVKAIEGEENAIRSDFTLAFGEYLSLSAYLEQRPLENADRPIAMPPTDGEKCIDMADDPDEKTRRLVQIDLYEHLLALLEQNEGLKKLNDSFDLSEGIEEALNELREELAFEKHYKNYTSDTRWQASNAARELFSELESQGVDASVWNVLLLLNEDGTDGNNTWGKEEFERTVKLYFDENGNVTVLDDGKMGFIDYTELERSNDRENLYVELLFSYFSENPLCGITAVYTDDPSDLPENLPTVYNYLDRLYEWNGKPRAIGGFAVGTSPHLSEGKSTAEERIRAEIEALHARDEKIAELNSAAKRIHSAVNSFLSANPSFFRSDVLLASIIVKYDGNRGWIVESLTGNDLEPASQSALFTNGVPAVSQLTDYLNRRFPEFEPVTAQIHFVRGDGAADGGSVDGNAPTGLGAMSAIGTAVIENGTGLFQDGNLPDALDFWTGYCGWAEHNPTAVPQVGVYWTGWSEYTLVGTYCKETNAPLADWDEVYGLGGGAE